MLDGAPEIGRPWAIHGPALDAVFRALATADLTGGLDGEAPESPLYLVDQGTARVQVRGVLLNGDRVLAKILNGTRWADLQAAFAQAKDDPAVSRILLEVDSPGGDIAGMQETARALRAAGKPTATVVKDRCGSAAMYLAQAGGPIWCARMAWVGCIGVALPVGDGQSSVIVSELTPEKNLDAATPEGREQYQQIVNDMALEMLGDLAQWKGLPDAGAAAAYFQRGRTMLAPRALGFGIVQGLGTDLPLDSLFNSAGTTPAKTGGEPMTRPNAARAEAAGDSPPVDEPVAEGVKTPEQYQAEIDRLTTMVAELQKQIAALAPKEEPATEPPTSPQGQAFAKMLVNQGSILAADARRQALLYDIDPARAMLEAPAAGAALRQPRGDAHREEMAPRTTATLDTREKIIDHLRAQARAQGKPYADVFDAYMQANPKAKDIMNPKGGGAR